MVNPIDHQLSYWKVEQNAEAYKDPASAARQSLEDRVSENEAYRRNLTVQSGQESSESQRIGVKEREAGGQGGKSQSKKKESEGQEEQETQAPQSETNGLDLYA